MEDTNRRNIIFIIIFIVVLILVSILIISNKKTLNTNSTVNFNNSLSVFNSIPPCHIIISYKSFFYIIFLHWILL